MLDLHRLRVLRAVVASGSVHEAAANLNFAPATISQHLRTLQRDTGLLLFERSGRGITPTQACLRLAEQSDELLGSARRLELLVADLRDGRSGSLAIACFASVARTWVPEVAAQLTEQFPGLLMEVSLNEPHEGPGRQAPDIAVRTEIVDGPPVQAEATTRHVLAEDSFRIVLPAGHRLADVEEIPLAELADERWIDNDIYDSPTGQIVLSACRAAGFTPRYVARLDDHRAAVALVAAGLGVTLLADLALEGLPAGVVTRPVTHPSPRRRIIALVAHRSAHHRPVQVAMALLHEAASARFPAPES